MKKPRSPHNAGRKRRATGWTLLTLGVIVAGVWAWSGSNCLIIYYSKQADREISVAFGAVMSEPDPTFKTPGIYPQSYRTWVFWYRTGTGVYSGRTTYWYPFWPIPILLWISTALLLSSDIRARRRMTTNTCPKCGYSLAKLEPDAPCPECGRVGPQTNTV